MPIIPTELLFFGLTIWVYVKLRKILSPVRFLAYGIFLYFLHHKFKGITIPLPLSKPDFDKYKAAKEFEKKDKNAYEKKRQSKKGPSFPLKTITVNDEYVEKVCSVNYLELDFLCLLAVCSIAFYLLVELLNFTMKSYKEINLGLSMEFFTVSFMLYYLLKNAFVGGIWKSDEAKVALFLGAQSWMISYVLLYITPEYVDTGFPKSFEIMMSRLNEALGGLDLKIHIGYEYFCGILATIAALITIGQTKNAVGFSYYYHSQTKEEYEKTWIKYGYDVSKLRKLKVLLHVAFIAPVIIIVLYIPSLTKNYFVPIYLSENVYDLIRIFIVISYAILKLCLTRKELQWNMDQSYGYIKALPYNTNDQYYNAMTQRMLDIVNNIWTSVIGLFNTVFIPIILGVLILHKGLYLFRTENLPAYNFNFLYANVTETKTEHAAISPAINETQKVKTNPFAIENLSGIATELNSKGLIPAAFYKSAFGFALFWWIISYFAITLFALLYYRRFQANPAKKKFK